MIASTLLSAPTSTISKLPSTSFIASIVTVSVSAASLYRSSIASTTKLCSLPPVIVIVAGNGEASASFAAASDQDKSTVTDSPAGTSTGLPSLSTNLTV